MALRVPSNKILIALQFWEGDKAGALKLAQYLADLENRHTDLADLILVNRYDCKLDFQDTIKYVSRKFNTFSYTSKRRGTGWPDGCNSLWFGTMEWVYSYLEAGKIPAYKAIFTCEADGAPVFPDWISRMSAAWDATQKLDKPVYIAGPLVKGEGVEEHVNGNCLVSGKLNFLHWITRRIADCPPRAGWDYALRYAFKQWGWANIPGMVSYYNTPRFSGDEFREMKKKGLIWIHGDKSNCLIDYGRELLFPRA
jgi:hypothetical protein